MTHISKLLVSINLTSNRPTQLTMFLDKLEASASRPERIEVIVKIDDTDAVMNRLLPQEVARHRLRLKYISTPLKGGFYGLWRSMNDMLTATSDDAYFVLTLNDEMSFDTPGWDDVLEGYVGLFPDHIFRLRTSVHRHRNYYDVWEAGFANDTSAFMTKRWVDIGGDWCPCNGPDTFQEMVAFYFGFNRRFDQNRDYRDIAIDTISFGGHGDSAGMTGEKYRQRQRGSLPAWFKLMSPDMQEEASRRAEKLRAHIWAEANDVPNAFIEDNRSKRQIELREPKMTASTVVFPYGVNRLRIKLSNVTRILNFAHYCAGGEAMRRRWISNFLGFLCLWFEPLDHLVDLIRREPIYTSGKRNAPVRDAGDKT